MSGFTMTLIRLGYQILQSGNKTYSHSKTYMEMQRTAKAKAISKNSLKAIEDYSNQGSIVLV